MGGGTVEDADPADEAIVTDLEPAALRIALQAARTELARTRAALTEAQSLYNLVEELPFSIYRKDREGRFVFANRLFCQALGRPLREILGRTDHDFSAQALAEKYVGDDRRVLETGEPFEDVEQHLDRDGEPTYIQIFKLPARDAAGAIVGTHGFWVDVTPLKRTEAALKKRTADLEAALTALRHNQEKLLVSEKMASLGRLTAGIAHEMNTPLAAVRAALADLERLVHEYAESVGDPQVSPEDHKEIAAEMGARLRLARNAAERTVGFVRGIKAQTRNLSSVERRRFDAVEVAREALVLLGHELRRSSTRLEFRADPTNIVLEGNAGRLAQVVTNLVTNAVDALRPRGGRIAVTLRTDSDDLVLVVEDGGCGITPEHLSRIFDPMFTTKPFGEGTGLGLTIVHDIVTGELGGTIEVSSQPGQGTSFTVRLPRPKEETHGTKEQKG
jgi:PAS domain S-box-containing protein